MTKVILTSLFLLGLNMSWLDYLSNLEASKQLMQYPDTRLYNAAALLKPEDRPRVPVRLFDDPDALYQTFGRAKGNPRVEAVVAPDKKSIFVNKKKDAYKNKWRLAGVLAHEGWHERNSMEDEYGAKKHEVDILKGFGPRVNPEYMRGMDTFLKQLK
jgi:hypothetical protein